MGKHIPRLDSLRGIAALMVAGSHLMFAPAALGFLTDGRIGVSIFFVLSGLVLGKTLRKSGAMTVASYAHFCLRRLFRIYPAYFVSTLLYLFIYWFINHGVAEGRWTGQGRFDYFSKLPLTGPELAGNFLFLSQALNLVTWTLKVEVYAAVALPFMHLYSRSVGWPGRAALLAVLAGLSFLPLPVTQHTRVFLYLFYIGYLLSELPDLQRQASGHFRIGLALLAVLALLYLSHVLPLGHAVGVLLAAAGSALLLVTVLIGASSPLLGILDHPLVRLLGITSYSFYLLNLFCVDLLERVWGLPAALPFTAGHPHLAAFLLFLASTALCLAGATCFYFWIERPCLKWGARFCERLL